MATYDDEDNLIEETLTEHLIRVGVWQRPEEQQPRQPHSGLVLQVNDGGRAAAGFKGQTGDCVTRAIAIATGLPYRRVYDDLAALGKQEPASKRRRGQSHPRTGVYKYTYRKYLASLGWTWVPTMFVGKGCQVHLKAGELPRGKTLIVDVSRHSTVVRDNIIMDTHDPSRGGTRCVYGYWYKPATEEA